MRYRFDEIAYNSTAKKKPTEDDKETYIGLEHLDSECLTISRWGSEVAPVGEKLIMKKGDILFGKRRAYQRKVGIAPFDGIFSAHGMVLRPNEEVINPNFFPFFISSDQFMERAVRISVGGLSPTINWKDLREQEFDIPSLDEQKELADKLWAAYNLKESYKKLLSATDEMVKSQFIEMFSDVPKVGINTLVDTIWGSSPDSKTYNDTGEGVPFYQGKTEFGDLYINAPVTFCTAPVKMAKANAILMSVRAPVGAVNIATQDCCIGRGLASITPKEGKSTTMFIYYALKYMEEDIDRLGTGSTFKAINKESYAKIQMPNAEISDQTKFVSIAEQADKSKLIQNNTLLNNKLKFCYCYTPRHISS